MGRMSARPGGVCLTADRMLLRAGVAKRKLGREWDDNSLATR